MKKALLTILTILALDQWLKVWVKLNFAYGEARPLIPGWFELQFVENPGMAFGWIIPGTGGKLALSIFRILVVSGIVWYLWKNIKRGAHWGYVICISFIVAGALGNILDSAVYGLIFDKGAAIDGGHGYFGVATTAEGTGYAKFLMGNVVDMFHFTKIVSFPQWFPFWGGETREIFPPVFNIADSSITAGIILILIFQKRFFGKKKTGVGRPETGETNLTEDQAIVNS